MKTIVINASPRKNMNTAKILDKAAEGAKSVGDSVEYIDLYDLNYTGCRSCMACKIKDIAQPCKCYWKDDITDVVNGIFEADRLIIGTPIYFGQPTAQLRALFERIFFPALSYSSNEGNFKGKVDVDVFLTMNVNEKQYNSFYGENFEKFFAGLNRLNGCLRIHKVYDTKGVDDYSKYEMAMFDPTHKQQVQDTQFPLDLENAFKVGVGI